MTTPQQTQAQIDAAMRELGGRAEAVVRGFVEELWVRVVEQTPVDTPEFQQPGTPPGGVARGNWNFSVGAMDTTFSDSRINTGAAPALPNVEMSGKVMYMTNATPYIHALEYGGYPNPVIYGSRNVVTGKYIKKTAGWVSAPGRPTPGTRFSPRAPKGWVRLAAAAAQNLVPGIVTRISQTPNWVNPIHRGQFDQPQVPRFDG